MSYYKIYEDNGRRYKELNIAKVAIHSGIVGLLLLASVMGGCPIYNVWQQDLQGQAELARAEQNRRIAIEEARAAEESAKSYANAEVIRAEGVAKANAIIQDGLGGPDGYLRYLWIQNLPNGKTVYVPTEAGLPITEAGREVTVE